MTDQELLEFYAGQVSFWSAVCGPGCEIAVLDAASPEPSVVAASGSTSGSSMADFARELYGKAPYNDVAYLTNYNSNTQKGDFLSSAYFIKNEGRLVGVLCVRKETSAAQEAGYALRALLERFNLSPQQDGPDDSLTRPVASIMRARIAEIIAQSGVPAARMSMEEKVRTVHRLNDDGVMMMKGAVAEIAAQLSVSVPTVYRYLNKTLD